MNQRPTPIFLPSSPSSNSPMEQLGRLGYGFSLLEEQVQLVLLSERICAGPIQTGDVLGGGGGAWRRIFRCGRGSGRVP